MTVAQIVTAEISSEKIITFYIKLEKTSFGVKIYINFITEVTFPGEQSNWVKEMDNNVELFKKVNGWENYSFNFVDYDKDRYSAQVEFLYKINSIRVVETHELAKILSDYVNAGFPNFLWMTSIPQ